MTPQTIYFLQAVWDISEQRERVLAIAKDAISSELERTLKGAMDERTIYISSQAKEARRKMDVMKNRVGKIRRPSDLLRISAELDQLTGQIMAMQMTTLRTLLSVSGPVKCNLHILAWQLSELAVEKLKEQSKFQIYRSIVLGSEKQNKVPGFPAENDPKTWLSFYLNTVQPYIDRLEEPELDGRWAYERKSFVLYKLIRIEQFVRTSPSEEELSQPPGIAGVGSGPNGEFRVFGRGRITNLTPETIYSHGTKIYTDLASVNDYSTISELNRYPSAILNSVLKGGKYLLKPEYYFEFINKVIIANTLHDRVKTGRCLYCGSPLHFNKCTQCGHVWNY